MRADAGENKWANFDVSYTSQIWEDHVVASEVFIIPTVVSGQGTRQLLTIINQGISEFTIQFRELVHEASIANHDHLYLHYSSMVDLASQRRQQGANFKEGSAHIAIHQKIRPFELQKFRAQAARELAEHLIGKFEQLEKVVQSVLTTQEEQGEQLTQTTQGVKRLTVSIKCVDTIWKEIIAAYTKLKKLTVEIQKAKMTLPPIGGQMQLTEIDGGEDDEGRKLAPQHIWIFDATDMIPDGTNPPQLGTVKELDNEEASAAEATPPSSAGSTLVEDFADKCQITSTSHEASEDSYNVDPSTPELSDLDPENASLPDTLSSEESNGIESVTVVKTEANGEEKAEEDGSDEDNALVEIVMGEHSFSSQDAGKEQAEVRVGDERKARGDSPVREESMIGDGEEEVEDDDDELEIICE